MAFTDQQIQSGSFVPNSFNWDASRIYSVDVKSPEFKEMIVRLYQNLSLMANVLNTKDSGYYITDQFLTGKVWFNPNSLNVVDPRLSFRKVINIGTVAAVPVSIAHGLTVTNRWKFTQIYGTASDTIGLNYYPLPYIGPAGYIELRVNGTHVIINNTTGVTFNEVYVVLEYLES